MDAKNSKMKFVVIKLSIMLLYRIMAKIINFFREKAKLKKYRWAHDCSVNGFSKVLQGKKCRWCDMSEEDEIRVFQEYQKKCEKREKALSRISLDEFFEI